IDYVAPLFQLADQLAARAHASDLERAVPDYQQISADEVLTWIGTQPAYLQEPMKAVMQAGSAGDVADLIGRYRAANQPPAPVGPTTPPAPKAELSDDAKQAAKSLAPVSSDRTVVPAGDDANDFEGVFNRLAMLPPT